MSESTTTPTPLAAVDEANVASTSTSASGGLQSKLENLSPLHAQLLMMFGTCHLNDVLTAEAKQVQRHLFAMDPQNQPDYDPSASGGASSGADKKKKKKKANTSAAASTPTSKATHSNSIHSCVTSTPSNDPSLPWSTPSLVALAASSDPQALLQLALFYDPANPWHLHLRDVEKAIKYYGLAAIKIPSTYACSRLAHFYITGEHIPGGRDYVKGAKWLRMGAMKGHALCQYQLGWLLEEGEHLPKDLKQACQWYRKAADQKYPQAMFNLGSILIAPADTYTEADGIEQDIYTGIRLLEDAAQLDDVSAQLKLGHLCFQGDQDLDIEASLPRTIQYLTMAAHHEHEPSVEAAIILGIIFSTSETNSYENEYYDLDRSIKYLKIAADAGHPNSKVLLQRQLARQSKVKKGIVMDQMSDHMKAVRLLSNQEGQSIGDLQQSVASTSSQAAAVSTALMSSTPSAESLFLALARLHARYPSMGGARLHAELKKEYPHWLVSLKRVKLEMAKQGWSAEGATTTPTDGSESNAAGTIMGIPTGPPSATERPTPAIVLADTSHIKQRINEKAIVNDLD